MADNVAVLLMSHGDFAKAALESAELIVGKQENCATLSVFVVDEVAALKAEMMQKAASLDNTKGLLVLTDIIGGTPMNLAGNLLVSENTIVCSGLSLPILLEVLMNRNHSVYDLVEVIQNAHGNGLTIRTNKDMDLEDDEDDLL